MNIALSWQPQINGTKKKETSLNKMSSKCVLEVVKNFEFCIQTFTLKHHLQLWIRDTFQLGVGKSNSLVLLPSKRSSPALLPLTTAKVSALCLVPTSAGAGPRLAPHAPGLCKLFHVHMLRMVQAPTPIFHHLPVPCTYTQRQGLRWMVTATLHLVEVEKFQMLTCSPQE